MDKITEEFIHYIWRSKNFINDIKTSVGENIEIIDVGTPNINSGPDFFNSKVKIDNTIWAGNIEIHKKSSDWNKHGHTYDKSYDNVILHVVGENDSDVKRSTGELIPTIEIKYSDKLFDKYLELKNNTKWIACQSEIQNIDKFIIDYYLNNLLIERIERKTSRINLLLSQNNSNWEETFYQLIARSFGFGLNSDPFELLAKSLPLNILAKHKNNKHQVEALLFGQAGFLDDDISDEYYLSLKKEYDFLRKKFNLIPIDKHLWKFLRLRPGNFPTIRISQFASLIVNSSGLFSKIINANSIKELKNLFNISSSEYWKMHYVFGKMSDKKDKTFGLSSFNNIVINTIVPIMFVYGNDYQDEDLKERAIYFLEKLPPEINSVMNNWTKLGFKIPNAYYSQAFLQLKNEYCNFKNCLKCQIGNKIINL